MGVFLKVENSTFGMHLSVICGSLCLAHEADAFDPLLALTGVKADTLIQCMR